MKKTINETLVLMKIIRERMNELKILRSEVSRQETYSFRSDNEKIVEPRYDVKTVDKKITELQNFLYVTEAKIKQSNAVTQIDVDVDVDSLLQPLV